MGVALGWLVAITLAGADMTPDHNPGNRDIVYALKLVETDGLGWRETAYSQLQPVARQGAATVWTAPREVMTQIMPHAVKGAHGAVLQAPKVTGASGQPVHVSTRSTRQMITQVAFRGEDAAPKVTPESLRVGTMATMAGRKLDQGILVQIVLEDTQILAVHKVSLGKCVQAKVCAEATELDAVECKPFIAESYKEGSIVKSAGAKSKGAVEPWKTVKETEAARLAIEIPEVGGQEVSGEWLVPRDGVLLISLGVHTIMGEDGKAVVRERLAVLEAEEGHLQAAVDPAPIGRFMLPALPAPASSTSQPLRVPHLGLGHGPVKIPTLPGRSIPQGMHADGTLAEAPAVPADEVDLDALTESSEPIPSPQIKGRLVVQVPGRPMSESEGDAADEPAPAPKLAEVPAPPRHPGPAPIIDLGTTKVEFKLPKLPAWLSGNVAPMSGLQFMMPIKPLAIKLPFNQKLEIEVIGKVVPDPDAAANH